MNSSKATHFVAVPVLCVYFDLAVDVNQRISISTTFEKASVGLSKTCCNLGREEIYIFHWGQLIASVDILGP